MVQTVQIRVVNAKVEDIDPATGKLKKRQDIVVAWNEKKMDGSIREQLVSTTLFNEQQEMFEHCQYKPGDEVQMDFNFSTFASREGKVFTSIRAAVFN